MQSALELTPLSPPPRGRARLFADLDPDAPSFRRIAAERIAALNHADAIESALASVPDEHRIVVETLAVCGLALRIARMPELEDRRLALTRVPPDLLVRVQPHVARYFQVKPWRRKEEGR